MPYIGNTPADKFLTLAKQSFSTSATTSYTLDNSVSSTQDIALFINSVRQSPVDAYTVSGTSLTLTSATAGTDEMYCVYLGKTVGTVSPASDSVTTAMIQSNAVNNAKMADDAIGVAELSATGTASSSTFLRGDNAWASAGGDNTPAFFATLSADTTISDDTVTKVAANTEVFDTDNCYDNSSNYRFTPDVAGKYYVFGYMQVNCTSGELTQSILLFKKNGSTVSEGELNQANSSGFRTGISNATIVDMNGSSDYVEMYAMGNVGSGTVSLKSDSGTKTCFGGYKIIT